jgi:hypothetical protein
MTAETGKSLLYRKISTIAGKVGSVAKDGYNPQLKYRYPTPATVIEAVKDLLCDEKLAIVPTITGVIKEPTGSTTQSGAQKVITRVEMIYLILDGDSGESLSVPWVGEGEDWSDKGIAKAQTIALRTFLINLFQIPSGDDDPDAGQVKAPQPATYQQPAPAPAAKSQPSRAKLIEAVKAVWKEEKDLGGKAPAAELAYDLDDERETPSEKLIELGKAARARVNAIKAARVEAIKEMDAKYPVEDLL